MIDTIEGMTSDNVVDQQQLTKQLLAQAKDQGINLVGPGGLLSQLTKRVPEAALAMRSS